jgi:dipeptidase D
LNPHQNLKNKCMTTIFNGAEPQLVFKYFYEITQIPRPSKKEEKIVQYIKAFGESHQLETIVDKLGNVVIRKPAVKGYENLKPVVLQSHLDMVCEKNSDIVHDFDKDPIKAYADGEWIKAHGTTLGADDGIGVAVQLAILASNDIVHGTIECLFTIDEETGLSGAFGLSPDVLESRILLNLDSEDWGEIFIGCAGGKDTKAEFKYKKENIPAGMKYFKINVSGLKGGHSGDEIHKGLGNAVKVLNRILWELTRDFKIRLSVIDAGNLRNAIAREGYATFTVSEANTQEVILKVKEFEKAVKNELSINAPDLKVAIEAIQSIEYVIDKDTQLNLLYSLYACPHGVIAWSAAMPGLVETSTNLASVKTKDTIIVGTSQRSSVDSSILDVAYMVQSVFKLAGATVESGDGYPGWQPDLNSEILGIASNSYVKLFGQKPVVRAIHAGLECGLIGKKYPGMDMISFGPTVNGAHSPDERLNIKTTQYFWDFTLDILKNIPSK